jgi:hypothetical protein
MGNINNTIIEPDTREYRNMDDIPLASVPLSELMNNNDTVCALCGYSFVNNDMVLPTKEMCIDGGIYIVHRNCPNTSSNNMNKSDNKGI